MRMLPILFNTDMVRAILDERKSATRRVVKPQPPETANLQSTNGRWAWSFWKDSDKHWMKVTYQPGDILYARETWGTAFAYGAAIAANGGKVGAYVYKADGGDLAPTISGKWSPSIHMPREAARIWLRVTGVRAERIQDITVDGVLREGTPDVEPPPICRKEISYPESFPKGFDEWDEARQEEWIQSTARARYIGWCDYADRLIKKFAEIWNKCYASPQSVKENGIIVRYESYPWEDIQETRTYRGLPWLVIGNPWVWVIEFERCEKPEGWTE